MQDIARRIENIVFTNGKSDLGDNLLVIKLAHNLELRH